MPRLANKKRLARKAKAFNFWDRLKEIDMFFQKRDKVHQSMYRLVKRLEKAKIPYAIMGGMAVNAHNHQQTTGNVDVLLTQNGIHEFRDIFVPRDYSPVPQKSRRVVDRRNDVVIQFLVAGQFPGSGKPGPIAFPDPSDVAELKEKVRVVDLLTLIQLKLAAGRYRDFGDVVSLINMNHLDEAFLDQLHASVRRDFIECLDEKRREDEYIARNG